MKVVHLSRLDNRGGSAKSALKIHYGLRNLNVDSKMYVSEKEKKSDPTIKKIIRSKFLWMIDKKFGEVMKRLGYPDLLYFFSHFFYKKKDICTADIIQVYNIHGGFFEVRQLKRLARNSIVVWRLSDMWAFTGHCAYSYNCEKWKNGCKKCEDLQSYPEVGRDHCNFLWKHKKKVYDEIQNLHIVTPSKWLFNCVEESPLLQGKKIKYIPNGVDCSVFRPTEKQEAKKCLGLDDTKLTLLFLAANINEERKGLRYLLDALNKLGTIRQKINIVCVGKCDGINDKDMIQLGVVNDEKKMALIYSAADIYVLPTLADNLPNTIIECMACKTAVIAFNIGGVPDVVRHMDTGYLVEKEDINGLAKGIRFLLDSEEIRNQISENAMRLIQGEFTIELQAKRFWDYYNELLKEIGRDNEKTIC